MCPRIKTLKTIFRQKDLGRSSSDFRHSPHCPITKARRLIQVREKLAVCYMSYKMMKNKMIEKSPNRSLILAAG